MNIKDMYLSSIVRRHKNVSNFLLVILSTFSVFLVAELFIYYVLDFKNPGYKPTRFFQKSVLTGHLHKPNAEGYWYRYYDGSKYKVSINGFGFSDTERTLQKTRPRIAMIGDSTTEFWEANEHSRGHHVIEYMLNEQFEVLNFGVRGYGTDQTQILFENIGIHFNPDIVIYTFCINDIENNSNTNSKPYYIVDPDSQQNLILRNFPVKFERTVDEGGGLLSFLIERSYFFRNLYFRYNGIGKVAPIESHFELRPYLRNSSEVDIKKMEITLKIIALLKNIVEKNGMKFLMVEGLYRPALPGPMQETAIKKYGEVFDFDKVTKILEKFSAEQGIEFLSLPKIVIEKNIPASGLMHSEDTMHLNNDGVSFYADAVVSKLRSLGWL